MKQTELRRLIGKWLEDNEEWMCEFLEDNDFEMFEQNMKLSQVVKLAREKGLVAPLRHISMLVKDHKGVCDWWGRRTKPVSRNMDADAKYWDELKAIVEKNILLIQGKDIDFAMRVVKRFTVTNKTLLNGLPERLKVWNR